MGDRDLELPDRLRALPVFAREEPAPLSAPDEALRQALGPFAQSGSPDGFAPGRRIVAVLPDATRPLPTSLIEGLLDCFGDRLDEVRVANGTHRRSTELEQRRLLGRWLGRIPIGDRSADDPSAHERVPAGASIDRRAARAEALVLAGPISFHYLAGFGGGGKLLAPGLADRATAESIHRGCLAPDAGRSPRARAGQLSDNPLRERIEEICRAAPPQLYVIPLLDSSGRPVRIFAGDRLEAFPAACQALIDAYGQPCERHETVIVSAGGSPYDLDFVQAHKALEAAAGACRPGGTIVFVASCREGLPARHRELLARHRSAAAMERALRERFDIAGHTVWAAREKAERFRIRAITEMDPDLVSALGMEPCGRLEDALEARELADALLMPFGARFLPMPAGSSA